jgi:hypothetical protein
VERKGAPYGIGPAWAGCLVGLIDLRKINMMAERVSRKKTRPNCYFYKSNHKNPI